MPLKNRAQARKYIRKLAGLMGLADWQFHVDDGPTEQPDAAATVCCVEGRKAARIWLADAVFRATPEEQRHVCCHELVHCHHAHPDHLAMEALDEKTGAAWGLAMEYAVDGVAASWAALLPLP